MRCSTNTLDNSMCSTPSGITARITGRGPRSAWPASWVVLNAFRHHGPDHIFDLYSGPLPRAPCSTPSGITARITRSDGRREVPDYGRVLNAFRHHGPDHLIGGEIPCPPVRVLNAFRHHGPDHL